VDRLNVLYMPHPDPKLLTDWPGPLADAIGSRHDLHFFDYTEPPAPQFADVDAVVAIVGKPFVTHEMIDMAAADSTRLWQIYGTGLDHADVPYLRSKGMLVANCPGPGSAVALAECAMMHMLMLAKQYANAWASLQEGVLYTPFTNELDGQKLALLGFGASGRELARRAKSFGMEILAIDILEISDEDAATFGVTFRGGPDDIDDVLAQADYVSLHLHLKEDTRHIIDARRLELLKPSAILINVSRGELVDEEELAKALLENRIGGAGIDTYSQEPPDMSAPIFGLRNVTATPHNAGVTDGTARRRSAMVAENLDRLMQGLELNYLVG
jgi:phosphoglycerate dehydrogenase-like enzyme